MKSVLSNDKSVSAPGGLPGACPPELAELRCEIELVDSQLIGLLARRQELARLVGDAKRARGLPIVDPAREAGVVRRVTEKAREVGLPADAVRELFRKLIALSREEQQRVKDR